LNKVKAEVVLRLRQNHLEKVMELLPAAELAVVEAATGFPHCRHAVSVRHLQRRKQDRIST
jgi:hypothetical protein